MFLLSYQESKQYMPLIQNAEPSKYLDNSKVQKTAGMHIGGFVLLTGTGISMPCAVMS